MIHCFPTGMTTIINIIIIIDTFVMVIPSNILFSGDMFVNYDLKKSLNIIKLGSQDVKAGLYQLTINTGNKETAYQYIEWVNIGIYTFQLLRLILASNYY